MLVQNNWRDEVISEKVDERRMDMDMFSMMKNYGSKEDERNQKMTVEIIRRIDGGRGKEDMINIMGMTVRGTTEKDKENVTETNGGLMTVIVTGFGTVIEIEIENENAAILIVIEIEIGEDSILYTVPLTSTKTIIRRSSSRVPILMLSTNG